MKPIFGKTTIAVGMGFFEAWREYMGLGKHIYGAINILPDSGKKSVWSATSYTERDKLSERRGGDGVESTISVCRKWTSYHLKLRFFVSLPKTHLLPLIHFKQSQWGRVEVPQFGYEIENYEKNQISALHDDIFWQNI